MFFEMTFEWTSVKLLANVESKLNQGNVYQHIALNCLYLIYYFSVFPYHAMDNNLKERIWLFINEILFYVQNCFVNLVCC